MTRFPFLRETTLFLGLLLPVSLGSAAPNDRALRTREFVVMGYQGIQGELRGDAGPYLETLRDLLGYGPDERAVLIGQVKELSAAHANIMDFADAVASLKPPAAAAAAAPPVGPNIRTGGEIEGAFRQLTRGSPVTLYLKTGDSFGATFVELQSKRVWLRGAPHRSVLLGDLVAVNVRP